MSWWSTSEKVVDTASQLLMDPNAETDSVDIVLQAVVGDVNLTNAMMDDILWGGGGIDIEGYYEYGRTKYVYGLPTGETVTGASPEAIEARITQNVGEPVVIDIINTSTDAYPAIYEYSKNWDANNPPQGVPKGGYSVNYATFIGTNRVRVEFQYRVFTDYWIDAKQVNEYVVSPTHGSYAAGRTYHYVKYKKASTGDEVHQWEYQLGTGIYPDVEGSSSISPPYYPVVPLVRNGNRLWKSSGRLQDDSAAMLEMVGINYEEFGEMLFDPEGGDGTPPDPSKMDYIYFHFATNLGSSEQAAMRYNFEYLKWLRNNNEQVLSRGGYFGYKNQYNGNGAQYPPINRVVISEQTYSMNFEYYFIEVTVHTGSVLPVGETSKDYQRYRYGDTGFMAGFSIRGDSLIFTHQVTATRYERVEVGCPFFSQNIEGMKTHNCDYLGHANDKKAFSLPLLKVITDQYKDEDLQELVKYSMRVTVNAVDEVSVPWYQSTIFQVFIAFVGVLLSAWLGPAGFALSSAFLMEAIVLTGINLALAHLTTVVVNVGIQIAMDLWNLEGWVAQLLAAVGTIVITAVASGATGGGSFKDITSKVLSWPSLDDLMYATKLVRKGLNIADTKKQEENMEELAEAREEAKKEQDIGAALAADWAEEMREPVPGLAGMLVGADTLTVHSPDAYLALGLELNQNEASLSMITTFMDTALDIEGVSKRNGLII